MHTARRGVEDPPDLGAQPLQFAVEGGNGLLQHVPMGGVAGAAEVRLGAGAGELEYPAAFEPGAFAGGEFGAGRGPAPGRRLLLCLDLLRFETASHSSIVPAPADTRNVVPL